VKFASPPYEALIGWDPTERDDIAGEVAIPPASVPVPRTVGPSRKVTVPVGVPLLGAVAFTVAVKVTG